MATWISTHGIGAITDSNSTFAITAEGGSAIVTPKNSTQLAGWVHFAMPNPPATSTTLQLLAVDFSTQSATVEDVAIYLGNRQALSLTNLQKTTSFTESIAPQGATYTGKGIAVSIRIQFDGMGSKLRFQSVSIQV
ncbi:hypothetical protein F4803DRAFT_571352 [Xylaria telfairii]|nr:hypothetical protein F4803DRAFT_571352 [Xylaria telfairii]